MIILLIAQALGQTVWLDTVTGQNYDWTFLAKPASEYYQVIDYTNPFTPSNYNFNFNSELPDTCSGQTVTASETVEFADGWMASCSILGRKNMQKVSTIPNGIKLTYQGGDICFENNEIVNRRIVFELVCSTKEGDWQVTSSAYINYCKVGLTKNSIAGCPVQASRAWLWVLGVLIILVGLVAGIWYFAKKCEFPAGLPFKESAQSILTTLSEIGQSGIAKLKAFTNRSGGPAKNYEMV